jgi:chitodextrinase
LSFPVTGLSPGTTYTFEVQAVNSSGVESAWSTPVSATTGGTAPAPGVPSAPTTVITDVVSASQINVFWNAPAANQNITSYNLRINGATVIRGITYLSFPVTGLAANTTYTFEVQAVNSSGTESNWSVIKSATTASSSAALILSPEYFRVARYDEQDKNAQRSSALYLPVRIVMDFNFTGGHINRQTL